MPEHTGEFLDGLGNKITMLAVANPAPEENHDKLTTRAAGFGVVKFNKTTRQITMELWPRNVDISNPNTTQYPGWPRTISQQDNYARKAVAFLPTIEVQGSTNPVIQIIDESNGEIVYTLRINGTSLTPKVFKIERYTIKIGQHRTDQMKTLTGIWPFNSGENKTITVKF